MRASALVTLTLAVACSHSHARASVEEKILLQKVCGTTAPTMGKVIVGGKPAELGEFPWMALIGYLVEPRGVFAGWSCGGSLVTNSHVLTAAHCLHAEDLKVTKDGVVVETYRPVMVRLGELDYSTDADQDEHKDYDIAAFIIHKHYSRYHQINDLGIIKLKQKVTFTDIVRPICLPPPDLQSLTFVGYWPTVAGWGKTSFWERSGSKKLLKTRVQVTDQDECRRNLSSLNVWSAKKELKIDGSVLCASASGKDTCQGDSGGPLMFLHQPEGEDDFRNYIIGVVSYGYKCAEEGYPGVYTRISHHMSWILDNLDI